MITPFCLERCLDLGCCIIPYDLLLLRLLYILSLSLFFASFLDLSGLNGYNGLNGSMNGMGDYSQGLVGMMGRRLPNLNVSNQLNGLNGLTPLPGLTTPPLSAINGLNAFPLPRQTSSNTASMSVRCKYGQLGSAKGQFNSPHGFCLGNDEEVIVADTNNHRIQVCFKKLRLRTYFYLS